MKAVIQRVASAKVEVDGELIGSCGHGLLILLGVAVGDTEEDLDRMLQKILKLRIFEDENGKMNRSVQDINGEMLWFPSLPCWPIISMETVPITWAPPLRQKQTVSTSNSWRGRVQLSAT